MGGTVKDTWEMWDMSVGILITVAGYWNMMYASHSSSSLSFA